MAGFGYPAHDQGGSIQKLFHGGSLNELFSSYQPFVNRRSIHSRQHPDGSAADTGAADFGTAHQHRIRRRGLAVANRHKLDNTGLSIGIRSANDAISKLQIEDGALNNISSLLDRALTLASQAASDTFTGSRTTLDSEFQSVLSEITRNAQAAGIETGNANLNARSVFVGNTTKNTSASVTYVSFALTTAVDAQGLGISTQNITSQANAATSISNIQTAIGTLGTVQGRVGAAMNRLGFAISQAQTMSVSVRASESRIRDANIAEEAASLTKFNILTQS